MKKIAYSFIVKHEDVTDLLQTPHRTPTSREFNNNSSWIYEIRQEFCKEKFGEGKLNFRIFEDKLVLVNKENNFARVMVFTQEYQEYRNGIAERLKAQEAKASDMALSFTGKADILVGHESWSAKSQDTSEKRCILKFENGIPVALLECDFEIFEYEAPDHGLGFKGSASLKKHEYTAKEWDSIVKKHNPKMLFHRLTRDNGEFETHEYSVHGKYIPREAQKILASRINEFLNK